MQALVKTKKGVGFIEVQEVKAPVLQKEDDVLIRITAAGICGTDLHIYYDEFPYWPPVILGHEFTGTVVATGNAVTRFHPGDRVVAEPHTKFCGQCELCRAGNIQLCAAKRSPGWGINGAFSDYIVLPELYLHHVPHGLSDEIAALTEPTAIVVHGVLERGQMQACDTVAVIGAGPIALLAVVVAKAAGAKSIFLFGTDADEKLRFPAAKKLNADRIFNVMQTDATAKIAALTDGQGVDMVIEASGAASGINLGIALAKKCGTMAVLGLPGKKEIGICWADMIKKALDVKFSFSSSVSSWETALCILAKSPVDLSCLITHRTSIENWEAVFADCENGNAIKALFLPKTTG